MGALSALTLEDIPTREAEHVVRDALSARRVDQPSALRLLPDRVQDALAACLK